MADAKLLEQAGLGTYVGKRVVDVIGSEESLAIEFEGGLKLYVNPALDPESGQVKLLLSLSAPVEGGRLVQPIKTFFQLQ